MHNAMQQSSVRISRYILEQIFVAALHLDSTISRSCRWGSRVRESGAGAKAFVQIFDTNVIFSQSREKFSEQSTQELYCHLHAGRQLKKLSHQVEHFRVSVRIDDVAESSQCQRTTALLCYILN